MSQSETGHSSSCNSFQGETGHSSSCNSFQGETGHSSSCNSFQDSGVLLGGRDFLPSMLDTLPLDMLSFLRCLLLSEHFCIHLDNDNWQTTFKKVMNAHDLSTEEVNNIPKRILKEYNLIKEIGFSIYFRENHIKSMCFAHWLMNWNERDYNIFLFYASITTLKEFAPHWDVEITILNDARIDSFVEAFSFDVITRPVFQIKSRKIIDKLNLPEKVMLWDANRRKRYARVMKTGSCTVFRTRVMIVGCAGAGKSTLVKRLRNTRYISFLMRGVTSTVGLEVHSNIFEVDEQKKKLLEHSSTKQQEDIDVFDVISKENIKLLSIVDFGGQCAYYACHQVYLTERAIYLLVVDMSKNFEETVDATICQQHGTMFANWTYKDYFIFWLKSIHMYCGDKSPVILIPTHCEGMTDQEILQVYDKLWNLLPQDSNLHHHIERRRCFPMRFPSYFEYFKKSCPEELERCIVETVEKQKSWGENIPSAWLRVEDLIQENKSAKIIEIETLKKQTIGVDLSGTFKDVLRFYHEIGDILYFEEEGLAMHAVLDIEWFLDSFKYIITDSNHIKDVVPTPKEWDEFYNTGVLSDDLLQKTWESRSLFSEIKAHKNVLLLYMQRLGLIAIGEHLHFIPSMNKRRLDEDRKNNILNSKNKTSILYYKFNFLPIFIFHRLIVSCLKVIEWQPLTDDYKCIYTDAAIFQHRDHQIVLAASISYIQVHVYACFELEKAVVLQIRKALEEQIDQLTNTFHKNIKYKEGYSCGPEKMCENIDDSFIIEGDLRKKKTAGCPRHALLRDHTINAREVLFFWVPENNWQDEQDINDASKNFNRFSSLVNLSVEAVRMVFEQYIPQQNLETLLTDHKEDITRGKYKINKEEIPILYPGGNKTVSSMEMGITVMYKLLRNYTNIDAPTKGWGNEPVVGDIEKADDIERIRFHRNYVAHLNSQMITSALFKQRWSDLSLAIERLSEGTLSRRIYLI